MADEPEDKMTVRERRAQRAKATAIKTAPARMARKAIVPAIIILLIAAIVAGFYFTNKAQDSCPGHWHSTFDVYVQQGNDTPERMSFRSQAFDLNSGMPLRMHMHQGDNKNQFHFEPPTRDCMGLEEALGYVDVELGTKTLKLTGAHEGLGQAGTYTANETHPLRVFVQHVSDRGERDAQGRVASATLEWREHTAKSVQDYQLKDGERLLVLYGHYTDDQVAQFQAGMSAPDGYDPTIYR